MTDESVPGPVALRLIRERWPMVRPFRICGHTFEAMDVLRVSLETDGRMGQGEATGVYYRNDQVPSMIDQIERLRVQIEAGLSRVQLLHLLPPGGARNALDCAMWDLEAQITGVSAWQRARLSQPRALLSTFTCGADSPEAMAAVARGYTGARAIKLKLIGEPIDGERVRAVREVRPDVWLGVDANQGFDRPGLERLMPVLVDSRVELIEQPFPVGQEVLLEGFGSPIAIAADESVQCLGDLAGLVGRFDVVNIKLDKCGGLTEGLAMARSLQELGLAAMVGNMMGTSLAMAPAFLIGQLCKLVDLDGPALLKDDRPASVVYADGFIRCPETIWGSPRNH